MDWTGRRLLLTLGAVLCASTSIAALFLYMLRILPMYFFIDSITAPSTILLLIIGVYSHHVNERVFLNRLAVGCGVGLLATVAYDVIRLPLWVSGLIHFNPFFTNQLFGEIITGSPANSLTSIVVGWGYHYWNGFGFGVIYTLIAGSAKWYHGIIWALILEIGWLLALPGALHFRLGWDFVAVSLIGHTAYGMVLGTLSQKLAQA